MTPSGLVARRPLVEVFAVEPRSAQLIWRGTGPVDISVDGRRRPGTHPGGPTAIDIDDLDPDRAHKVRLHTRGGDQDCTVMTPAEPPGNELTRIATLSDLHFGARRFGMWFAPGDADGTSLEQRHPQRCSRAALADLQAWGAELLVVKGDCTDYGRPSEWDSFGRFLDEIDLPVIVTPGNHDTKLGRGALSCDEGLARIGRARVAVQSVDLNGARLIVADSTVAGRGLGSLDAVQAEMIELAGTTTQPVLVMFHQHLHTHRIPRMWPLGIFRSRASQFVAELVDANPAAFITTGHSHRNRRHDIHDVPVTEVGSVKDYPGCWAGYALHEGGIRQVIRRLSDHDALAWTERAALAVGGVWSHWSPGTLDQRCFSHAWVTATSSRSLTSATRGPS